jgi:hypothetical protein
MTLVFDKSVDTVWQAITPPPRGDMSVDDQQQRMYK